MLSLMETSRYLTRVTRTPYLLRSSVLLPSRAYALSRFDKSRPGVGRERPKASPRQVSPNSEPSSQEQARSSGWGFWDASGESQPSADQSPLWEQSVRPPSSNPEDGLRRILHNDRLIVTRQLEMLNIFIGFEQTNRYVLSNEAGETLGYIAEEPRGFLASFSRQIFRTHRPFRAVVMDVEGSPILWVRRPFAFINSRMYVQRLKDYDQYTPDGEPVLDTFSEVQQRWHPWRRRYDLFIRQTPLRILSKVNGPQPEPETNLFHQFAKIDGGILAWHFTLQDAQGLPIASVNRAFRGFGREIFTDTGRYFINFSGEPDNEDILQKPYLIRDLSIDERALILATAVNIDFDYFSRHSGPGGGFFLFESVD